MGDVNDGGACFAGELLHHVKGLLASKNVQASPRLIENENLRTHEQCARNEHILALALREHLKWIVDLFLKAKRGQQHLCFNARDR